MPRDNIIREGYLSNSKRGVCVYVIKYWYIINLSMCFIWNYSRWKILWHCLSLYISMSDAWRMKPKKSLNWIQIILIKTTNYFKPKSNSCCKSAITSLKGSTTYTVTSNGELFQLIPEPINILTSSNSYLTSFSPINQI